MVAILSAGEPASLARNAVPAGCGDSGIFRPVTIEVPANGRVSIGIDELLRLSDGIDACYDRDSLVAAVPVTHGANGSVAVVAPRRLLFRTMSSTFGRETSTPRFVYTPPREFSGITRGWEFSIYHQDADSRRACEMPSCGVQDANDVRIGAIQVSFEVRNELPVANDDAITLAPGSGEVEVPASLGLLANDVDVNGDPVMVRTTGVTRFPWGAVEIRQDGSYRVNVTDSTFTGVQQLRYLVWDQRGSPANMDYGILTITLEETAIDPRIESDTPGYRIRAD
jgi:hypothetical protein